MSLIKNTACKCKRNFPKKVNITFYPSELRSLQLLGSEDDSATVSSLGDTSVDLSASRGAMRESEARPKTDVGSFAAMIQFPNS